MKSFINIFSGGTKKSIFGMKKAERKQRKIERKDYFAFLCVPLASKPKRQHRKSIATWGDGKTACCKY